MKLHAPAAIRNREAIAGVLANIMPAEGTILEVAGGSGEHAAYFAGRFPTISYQPSDLDARSRASIDAHCAGLANVAPAIEIDATWPSWPLGDLAGIVNINMIHIAPWSACLGLIERASESLAAGGFLLIYGPFFRADVETAPSNLSFDRSLRSRDPSWGIRELEVVTAEAGARGLEREGVVEMPANNLSVIFRRPKSP
jgi:hypothetical protein